MRKSRLIAPSFRVATIKSTSKGTSKLSDTLPHLGLQLPQVGHISGMKEVLTFVNITKIN